jgi:hypothetical protein
MGITEEEKEKPFEKNKSLFSERYEYTSPSYYSQTFKSTRQRENLKLGKVSGHI